ncbi:MAG: hypothetical protein KGY69_14685 [Bacteroidales bacterium]|nr:hypothetical protein [Bacteroidales bacterium]
MKPLKFNTTVSSKGTIKIPFSKKLIGKDVEVTIRPKSNNKKTDISASDFIKKWAGFLQSRDTDADKYNYLSKKYS